MVNWQLGQMPDIGMNALAAFQQGRQQRQQDDARAAFSNYAANPNDDGLNALAQYSPEFVIKERERIQGAETEHALKRAKMIGSAAQWADTPEKWDAAVDQLARIYPEIASEKGQFSAERRMGAIAAAGEMESYLKQSAPVNMAPGNRLVDPTTGRLIAEAPFAPRTVTVGQGQTAVEFTPGATGAPSNPSDIFARMIGAESSGNHFTPDGKPLTSPAGAIGIAQVMPGTAPEAAQLAGLPFDENRYRTDPEYNKALGKAYFEKQLADFGDPALAVAAYNAGPGAVRKAQQQYGENWLQHVPAETQNYVRKVMGQGGGTKIIAQGATKAEKPKWKTLTPQEAQTLGLPAGTYQQGPDGEIKPIGGIGDKAPQSKEAYSQSAMDSFDRAINTGSSLLKHPGMAAAVGSGFDPSSFGSFNPLTGKTLNGTDAADFETDLESLKAQTFLPMVQSMKGMGALSNAEGDKLTAAIGNLSTRQSEESFTRNLNGIIADLKRYRARAVGGQGAPQQGAAPRGGKKPSVSNW